MAGYVYKETGSRALRCRKYRCPDCQGEFVHSFLTSEPVFPDRCPLCDSWVSSEAPPEEVFVPQAPRIRENPYARSIDQVYRAQESASIERAEEAVSTLEDIYRAQPKEDGPEEEIVRHEQKLALAGLKSGLKVTDMKDPTSMREGDTAAVAPTPPNLGAFGATAAFQNLGGVVPNHAPQMPTTGEPTRQAVVSRHAERAHAMTARGQLAPMFLDRR